MDMSRIRETIREAEDRYEYKLEQSFREYIRNIIRDMVENKINTENNTEIAEIKRTVDIRTMVLIWEKTISPDKYREIWNNVEHDNCDPSIIDLSCICRNSTEEEHQQVLKGLNIFERSLYP